jgi:hypothetical protein
MEMIDVYRVFHPATAQYTFFSAAHGNFSKIDHILGPKASLNKYKKIEITPCLLYGFLVLLEVEFRSYTCLAGILSCETHQFFMFS